VKMPEPYLMRSEVTSEPFIILATEKRSQTAEVV
jgi:hypothetical protein